MNNQETFTLEDIISTAKNYIADNSPEVEEPILYFLSDLTGMSIDALLEHI